ncbi:MAG: hypothetical protein HQ546_10900, partial [Planctomycetes bacterium]|nr:hypothetical protein [Planctomycetota bacterium]
MNRSKADIRIALQAKAVVVLALVIATTTLASGWAYHRLVSEWVLQGQLDEAAHLGNALRMTVAEALARQDLQTIGQVVSEFL